VPKMIFVNLPVTDLDRSVAFYKAVGATPDPRFTDDTAAAVSFSDAIHVMLLTHAKYSMFTSKPIADTHNTSAALLCISEESRAEVDARVERALAAGAVEARPLEDHGFMYHRSFHDPDGHQWEVMWMDIAAFEAMQADAAKAA
jgi:uncharacterized protein